MIIYESSDILAIARYLSEQGDYYSPQWEKAADEIERLREALRPLACECVNYCLSLENDGLTFFQDCPRFKARSALEEKE